MLWQCTDNNNNNNNIIKDNKKNLYKAPFTHEMQLK